MTEDEAEFEGYVSSAVACEAYNFSMPQLRGLVTAGVVRTERSRKGGAMLYCAEDLARLEGANRTKEPDEPGSMAAEIRALSDGYKQLLQLAISQTKQAQDHERQLVTAFSKPLEQLGTGSRELVTAVLDQNKLLVDRANAGDAARLDFVKAAETLLKDQRAELREQAELDRKHQLKQEVWEGVKKAGPPLLEGLKETLGGKGTKTAAVETLKAKLSGPEGLAKLAALLKFEMLDSEGIDALCTALGVSRADLEALNAEADAVPPEPEPEAPQPDPATEAQAAE